MKKNILIILLAAVMSCPSFAQRPATIKQKLAVVSIDTRGTASDPVATGNAVRIELEKLPMFSVMDKYEVMQFMEDKKPGMNQCFGKSCLTEIGREMKMDKMFSGSVEQLGNTTVITFRLLDMGTGEMEKTYVHEYLNLPEEIRNMIKLSVAEMFGQEYDKHLMEKLTRPFAFDNSHNNPAVERLQLDGPRMGFVAFTGKTRQRLMESKKTGGYEAYPYMFQFGYQFEKQYLNEGKIQALFELVPMITGLDQGYFIPSCALMHGLRSNIDGWEFAFGPTFNVVRYLSGYYDGDGVWRREREWHQDENNYNVANPYEIIDQIDRRGIPRLQSAFVLAFGRTFKSGKLNIPFNAFVVPGKSGWRMGVSFGFNAKNKV